MGILGLGAQQLSVIGSPPRKKYLELCFSNFNMQVSHLGTLSEMHILIQHLGGEGRDSQNLTSSQVLPMPSVLESNFE